MANVTITQLPAAGPITGDEQIPVVQNGVTVRASASAIASAPAQSQTFITVNQEPTLPNSRYLSTGAGLGLSDGGSLSYYRLELNGASGSLEDASTGIVVKDTASSVVSRSIQTSGNGIQVSNGNGVGGDPTISLNGLAQALADYSGTGLLTANSGTTVGGVQILGTADQITVVNGNGASGNPTISISDDPTIPGTGGVVVPKGTTAQQPIGTAGQIRYNTTINAFEGYSSGSWQRFTIGSGVASFTGGGTGLTPSTPTIGGIVLGGVLNASHGGTGATTLTGYVKGNGTSAMTASATVPTTDLSGTISNAQLANSSLTVNGVTISLGGSGTISTVLSNALTIGTGLSGTSYNGSSPVTIAINNTGVTAASYGAANKTLTATVNAQGQLTTLSETNIAISNSQVSGLGTMSTQAANNVAITGGSIEGTSIGAVNPAAVSGTTITASTQFTGPGTGLTGTASSLSIGGTAARATNVAGGAANQIHYQTGANTTSFITAPSVSNTYLQWDGSAFVWTSAGGSMVYPGAGIAVSTGSAWGTSLTAPSGALVGTTDSQALTNKTIDSSVIGGTTPAAATFTTLTANSTSQFGKGSANYLQATGAATTLEPTIAALGSDTNIPLLIQSKGTGAIDLAAGSSGVNISNGGTVTAVTRTAPGTGYTSPPTVTISAPTTAGGVQATVGNATLQIVNYGIAAAGSGYAVGDTITLVGGTGTATTFTVATLSGSGVATLTTTNNGNYSVVPTNPVTTTTNGSGTGCTTNMTWGVILPSITNAGSGYVEQPTVTFSGGGGSGATAYATVGSGVVLKSLGASTISAYSNMAFVFQSPNSIAPAFGIRESGNADSWVLINPNSAYTNILAAGATNANLGLYSNGAGNIELGTSGTSNLRQMRVSHTASAVNYVQVTGAATTGRPAISAQGSDTNVGITYIAKGTGIHFFTGNSGNQFAVQSTASAVNYVSATGAIATAAPSLSAVGPDTNIDLTLTPKGTGKVVLTGGLSAGVF